MPKRQFVLCSALSAARLASMSAASFPSMPTCPGVHLTESLMFGKVVVSFSANVCISSKMYPAADLARTL